MKILHLVVKKEWFDAIASGQKNVEYREVKPYWTSRLVETGIVGTINGEPVGAPKEFDAIQFRSGYQKDAPKITRKWIGMVITYPTSNCMPGQKNRPQYSIVLGEQI